MLPCASMTLSRFHRHACVQEEASKPAAAWQGSPGSSPNTGTVHVELDSGRDPKKYWVPSTVVTFQYSPLWAPLPPPVSRWIRDPSSCSNRHVFASPWVSAIRTPPVPWNDAVALSLRQHRSPTAGGVTSPSLSALSARHAP